MRQGKLGLTCELCGGPVPGSVVPLGGCICPDCWDTILDAEVVRLDDGPSGQQFPDDVPGGAHQGSTPTEERLERWTRPLGWSHV